MRTGTVNRYDVFSAEGSGKVLGEDGNLLDAAENLYGGIDRLGSLRVNGAAASLDTVVQSGATILIIPKIEGGRSGDLVLEITEGKSTHYGRTAFFLVFPTPLSLPFSSAKTEPYSHGKEERNDTPDENRRDDCSPPPRSVPSR